MFFYLVFYFIVITCVCQCVSIKRLDHDDDNDDAHKMTSLISLQRNGRCLCAWLSCKYTTCL